jgi:YidC/Oxa1 family membrane protein insertase
LLGDFITWQLTAIDAVQEGLGQGFIYVSLVVLLAGLYFVQQRMVAARAAVSPTMSAAQQKLMQYLPVVFAIFQLFFMTGLVIYYIFQTLLRILQQAYITRTFYGHNESLGRQAQRAGAEARDVAKAADGKNGEAAKKSASSKSTGSKSAGSKSTHAAPDQRSVVSKRVTPSKSQASKSQAGKATSQTKGKPTPTRQQARSTRSTRPSSSSKKRR